MREMKDSGYSWLGKIPSSWKIKKVKHCFHRKNEKAMQNNPVVLSLARSGVKVRDISNNEGQIAESYFNYNPVDVDDILLNPMDLYSGANCSISKVKGVISPAYINLKALEGVNPGFFDYYFKVQYWLMAFFSYGKGVSFENRWTLNAEILMNYPLLVPKYSEQCKIKKYLDEKCSKIDVVLEKQKQIVEKLNIYKTALITEAVTKGVHPCGNTKKTSIGWISEIPSHWTEYRVANLYDQTNESGDESLPILTVSINNGISDRELKDDEQERVFVRSEDRTKYKRVRPGDLVYNMMRAWQGAFGAVRVNGMVSPAYITCRPKKNTQIDSRYIEYLFRTPVAVEEMHRYSHGIADFRLRLYWPEFKNIRLCTPPIQEQTDIADYIDEKCLLIDKLIEKRERLIKKMEDYKKSLIYECVTGKREIPVHIKDVYDTGIKPKVLEQISNHAKECGIHKVILFGSRARGTFHRDSDIDLAVSGGNIDFFRLTVEEETDTLLAYDVVNLDRTSNEELLDVIRKEGVIIYEEV